MSNFIQTVVNNIRKQPVPPLSINCEAEHDLQCKFRDFQRAYTRFQVGFYNTMRAIQHIKPAN